ncbi:LysR family transcriptional regulator [Mesorhizobium sp. M0062]|uniref:LysR family transcriptional regulator n=1 Tax=Mesorhizobium sp. M0062 TaxID=2956867 RepID=UPI003335E32A
MSRPSVPQLEAFFWTAELGSVQRAAEVLNVTQPTLSLRLKQVEATVRSPLLERHGRGLRMTRHGQAYLARVKIVLDAYNSLLIRSEVPDIGGSMRIGMAEGFAVACMAAMVQDLQADFPQLRPEWVVATSAGLEQLLADGHLDLAILVDPLSLKGIRLSALGAQPNGWAAPAAFGEIKATPRNLAKLTVVATPPPTAMYRATLAWFAEDKVTPRQVCVCSSLNAALQLVAAGLGVGIFPEKVIEAFPVQPALQKLSPEPTLRDGHVYLADRLSADEWRTASLLRTIERTCDRLGYFEARTETGGPR